MDYSNFFRVEFDKKTQVVLLTITKEKDKYKTFGVDFVLALRDLLEHYEMNREIKGLILTSEGDKVFSTGADISGVFPELDSFSARDFSHYGQRVFSMLENAPYITLAAINGFALGGGLEICLACDFRIASKRARLGLPEINLGLIPGWGGTQRLPRLIGLERALYMILSGETISAEKALEWGLVSSVVEPDQLIEEGKKFLAKLTEKSGNALRIAKRAIVQGIKGSLEDGLALENELFGLIWNSPDREEGIKAFLEKRKPRFTT